MKNIIKIPIKSKYKRQIAIIEELSYHTSKLYNIANYNNRNDKFHNYYDMYKLYKNNYHTLFLHSQTSQQCLKVLEQNWKSYFSSIKDYKKNPSKYKGEPRPPKFKNNKNKKNEIIFTKAGIRIKNNLILLSLSKTMKDKFKVQSLNFRINISKMPFNSSNIQQIHIQWNNSNKLWELIVIFNKEEQIGYYGNNIMSIDLGLDNLATCTFKDNSNCYIINGKTIKSKNSYYNKEIAKLTSIKMKQDDNPKYFKRSKGIIKLQEKRNNYINNYIHKASRKIINLAINNYCNTIVIGDFSGVKQNNTAKSFVQIPQQRMVDMIKYKAKLLGIEVAMQNESYTSGCSAIDEEEVSKKYYNKSRRIERGLFVSNQGIKINADQNGSINILRKYIKCSPKYLSDMRDNGYVDNPIRINIL